MTFYPPDSLRMSRCLSLALILFRFVSFSYFCFHWSRGPSFNRSSICMRPDSHSQLPIDNSCLCPFVFACLFFVSLEILLFPSIFVALLPFPLSNCIDRRESTSYQYVFPFRMVFCYLVTTDWIFYISLICEDSIIFKKRKGI